MKITKSQLKQIIKEELQRVLQEQEGVEQYVPQGYQPSDLYTARHLAGQEGYESSVRWADPEIQTSLSQRFGAGEEGRLAAREAGFAQGQHGQYMPFQGARSVMAGTHGSDPSRLQQREVGVSPAISRARAAKRSPETPASSTAKAGQAQRPTPKQPSGKRG